MSYIVVGSTGEWDDTREWMLRSEGRVLVYDKKEDARIVCELLNEAVEFSYNITHEEREDLETSMRESGLDKDCSIDYTGTSYVIREFNYVVVL